MKPIGTYVYCLVAGRRRPSTARLRSRLDGAGPIRLLALDSAGRGLKKWLVVSDVPLDRYGEATINRRLSDLDWVSRAALAHEAVVESFISSAALVPMKLFTIFTGDERAAEHIQSHRQRIDQAIARVRGRIELGVRVTMIPTAKSVRPSRGNGEATGAAYLSGKKAQRDRAAEFANRARDTVAELYDGLAAMAADVARRSASELPMKGGPLLLDAAFLVPRSRERSFRLAVKRQAAALQPSGYSVSMTGPWPPYTFVTD
jgi:hypothetical protein